MKQTDDRIVRTVAMEDSSIHGNKRRPKKGIFIRVDCDALDWFKSYGRGYQSRISEMLSKIAEIQKQNLKKEKTLQVVARAHTLYQEFYAQCFWHLEPDLKITPANIGLVVDGLRKHGGRRGYILAEELCQ